MIYPLARARDAIRDWLTRKGVTSTRLGAGDLYPWPSLYIMRYPMHRRFTLNFWRRSWAWEQRR